MPETSAERSIRTRQAAVVFNPTKVDADALKTIVATESGTREWAETLWFETSEGDPGQGQARAALAAGASVIIAAGGDGTVRAVAEALDGSDAVLALIPAGTGNLLARNLDLTLDDSAEAVRVAFTGADRAIDLGRIEISRPDSTTSEHVFVVMAGVGLDAKMLAKTDDDLKKKIGWLAYAQAIVRALRDTNQVHVDFRVDEGPSGSVHAHTLILGNCGTLTGNILLLPDAELDDGQLDIVLMRPQGFGGWLQIIHKVVWENGVLRRVEAGRLFMTKEVRALRYFKGREIVVRLDKPEEIELDGDTFGAAVGLTARIVPGGLTVRVPRAG